MKRLIRCKENSQLSSSVKYEVIGFVRLNLVLVLNDQEIAATSSSITYPGRTAFIQDVSDILSLEKKCTILDKHVSNRDQSISSSTYFVLECPLSDSKSVICLMNLRVSDHPEGESYFSTDYSNYMNSIVSKYFDTNKHVGFSDEEILVQMQARNRYQEALNQIRQDFDQLISGLKVTYHKFLK